MSIFQLWKFQLLLSINCTKIPVARATDFSRFLTFMSGIYYRSPSWIKQLWISMTFCGQKCNQNQGSKLPCGLINKSEKVFFVMYLELLKIPFELQLMKILEKIPFAAVSNSSFFFSWLTSFVRVTAWHLLTFYYKSWQAVNSPIPDLCI